MIGLFKNIEVKGLSDWINVYFISDVHLGNRQSNVAALKKYIEQIKADKRGFWVGTGDIFDAITYRDKRYDDEEHINRKTEEMIDDAMDLLAPVKSKCLAIGDGNHETKYRTLNNTSIISLLADELETTYYGYSCLMKVLANEQYSLVYYINHGYGGGRNQGTQIKKCEDAMKIAYAHFYVISHVHFRPVGDLVTLEISDKGVLKKVPHKFVVTGAYQDNYSGYAEKQMYPQASHGSPITQFRWSGHDHELQLRVIA